MPLMHEKMFVYPDRIEHIKYGKPIWYGEKRKLDEDKKERIKQSELSNEEIRKRSLASIWRAKSKIRRIITNNPQLNKFVTLTFDPKQIKDCHNISVANSWFKKFKDRFRYYHPGTDYISVVEFQKDVDYYGKVKKFGGAVHYHLLLDLPFIDINEFASKIWKYGFVKIKKVDHIKNLPGYMTKYLAKGFEPEKLYGKKKYFKSDNIKMPKQVRAGRAEHFRLEFLTDEKPTYQKTSMSETRGKTEITEFKLNEEEKRFLKKREWWLEDSL